MGGEETQGVSTHLDEAKLLLTGVVVAGGSLILLGRARAVLVAELVRGVNELPGVLGREERPTRPSAGERINRTGGVHATDYHSVIKGNEVLICATMDGP